MWEMREKWGKKGTAQVENEGGREKLTKKGSHETSEQVRSIVLEQRCAQCVVVRLCAQGARRECAQARGNVRSIALVQECVCENWAFALGPMCVGSSVGPCLGLSVHECVRSQSAEILNKNKNKA
jgi:hypothetical protein